MGHADVLAGFVRAVDPVADVGRRGQCLKSVQETRRDIEVVKVVVVQAERLLGAESRRIPAHVDEDIVHGTVCTADELRLASTRATVHAADDAEHRPRLRILPKGCGGARRADASIEDVRIEGSREETTVISERLRYQNEDTVQIGLLDTHLAMLSRTAVAAVAALDISSEPRRADRL